MTFFPPRLATILILLLALTAKAASDDVVFPPGSRIGLVPPPGLRLSQNFVGFEDADRNVAVVLAEFPGTAYGELIASMRSGVTTSGVTEAKREVLLTQSGAAYLIAGDQQAEGVKFRKWVLVTRRSDWDPTETGPGLAYLVMIQVPDQAKQAYSEAAIRTALASLSIRRDVPSEELLRSLPFKVTELAGFRSVRSLAPGRAILLSDETEASGQAKTSVRLVVSIAPGAPATPDDRQRFADELLKNIQGFADLRITNSEAMRIGGQPGFEIRLDGKESTTDADVTIVQWVRFGSQGFLHFLGIAPKNEWAAAFSRFRMVRDGIEPP
jgi:hypothetical protein